MITLINGPYNGRQIDDSGAMVIRMALPLSGERIGSRIGEAFYEPSDDRTVAFWNGNNWLGTLEEVIPA